jgi:pimeloyl-ACP methyl ester carboxylesterase
MDQMFNGLFSNVLLRGIIKILTWLQKGKLNSDLNPNSTLINAYTHLIETIIDRKSFLSKISAPTLVIGASKDKFFSEEIYRETADLIPNGEVVIFNSGHMVPVEKMSKVRKTIQDFLNI